MAVSNKATKIRNSVISSIVLVFFAITALIPIFLVVINSFKPKLDIMANPLAFPKAISLNNYVRCWEVANFGSGFKNSIILSGCTVVIVLFAATLAGYALAGNRVRGTKLFMGYFMVAMTVPIQLFLFPLYYAMSALHLVGTAVPTSFIIAARNLPFAIFLMRTFFVGIPKELEEAARIDGSNTRQLLWNVMVPMVSPGLITVSVIVALNSWNEYLITTTFLQGMANYTVTLLLRGMESEFNSEMGLMMAGAMIVILPILLFFLLTQRYFIDGLVSGAVKG